MIHVYMLQKTFVGHCPSQLLAPPAVAARRSPLTHANENELHHIFDNIQC